MAKETSSSTPSSSKVESSGLEKTAPRPRFASNVVQDTNQASRAESPETDAGRRHVGRVRRVVIEGIWPQIAGGAYPVKRTVGERVVVEADLLADGHDRLAGAL